MWEYKFIGMFDTTRVEEFNQLGEQRWEFVAIYHSTYVTDAETIEDNYVAIFKRKKL